MRRFPGYIQRLFIYLNLSVLIVWMSLQAMWFLHLPRSSRRSPCFPSVISLYVILGVLAYLGCFNAAYYWTPRWGELLQSLSLHAVLHNSPWPLILQHPFLDHLRFLCTTIWRCFPGFLSCLFFRPQDFLFWLPLVWTLIDFVPDFWKTQTVN